MLLHPMWYSSLQESVVVIRNGPLAAVLLPAHVRTYIVGVQAVTVINVNQDVSVQNKHPYIMEENVSQRSNVKDVGNS